MARKTTASAAKPAVAERSPLTSMSKIGLIELGSQRSVAVDAGWRCSAGDQPAEPAGVACASPSARRGAEASLPVPEGLMPRTILIHLNVQVRTTIALRPR
jgi:hypothetical protein